jgi:hypothetical protein
MDKLHPAVARACKGPRWSGLAMLPGGRPTSPVLLTQQNLHMQPLQHGPV